MSNPRATKQLGGIPAALLRRALPNHPRYGFPWIQLHDGSITFREEGFVSAASPALLLARHNYETACIRNLLANVDVSRSLEVGCGYGRLSPTFAEFSRHHSAVDLNREALDLARTTYPGVSFQESSASDLPFPNDYFQLVSTWTVLQHIPPDWISSACSELLRVLVPGGLLLSCEETCRPGRPSDIRRPHIWHRQTEEYARLVAPLSLTYSRRIDELDRLDGIDSPGQVMLWR